MLFIRFSPRYKRVCNLVDEATSLINAGKFDESLSVSNRALEYIAGECRDVEDINFSLVHAELLLIRADSRFRISTIDDSLTQVVMNDYSAAMSLLDGHEKGLYSYHRACIFAGEYLLQASVLSTTDHLDQSYDLVKRGNQAIEDCPGAPVADKMLAKASLAKCLGLNKRSNSHYDIGQAIVLMTEAHRHFAALGDKDYVVSMKHMLSDFHITRFRESGDGMDLEQSIQFLKELTTIIDPNHPSVPTLFATMGKVLLERKQTFRKSDIEAALEILTTALNYFDKEENFEEWASVAVDLIDATVRLQPYYPGAEDNSEIKTTVLRLIRELATKFSAIDEPYVKYRVTKLLGAIGRWYPEEALPDQTGLLRQLCSDLEHETDCIDLYVEVLILLESHEESSHAIRTLEATLGDIDRARWPQSYLDLCLELSRNLIDQSEYDRASPILLESLEIIDEQRRLVDRNNQSHARSLVFLNDRAALTIPFSLASSGLIRESLQALELLCFHPVKPVLEELLVISLQIDRRYWLLQQKSTKQFELFMQVGPKSEDGNEPNDTEFQKRLEEKRVGLKRSENYYRDVDRLIAKHHVHSQYGFVDSIERNIPRTSSWVLVPLLCAHETQVLLVPPKGSERDIFALKKTPGGYLDVLKMMSAGEHGGWLGTVMNQSAEIASIRDNPNIPDFKKSALLENFHNVRRKTTDKMEQFLYETVWAEALSVILNDKIHSTRSVVVIAQGPYSALPFGLARCSPNEKHVLDFVDISYVPSLYVLYALTERLKVSSYSDSVAFLMQEGDMDNAVSLRSVPIEKQLIGNVFGFDNTHVGKIEPASMADACSQASYWHFSTHGKFSWHDYSRSKIEWTNASKDAKIDLTPEILAAFESSASIRLVTLSACQTAIPEFLDKELAPESFLTELLKAGAIGALGTLWEVPDIAAALVLGRFYHFHKERKKTPAQSLQAAQLWLRDASSQDICEFLDRNLSGLEAAKREVADLKSNFETDDKPFNDPFFWASFVLVGI